MQGSRYGAAHGEERLLPLDGQANTITRRVCVCVCVCVCVGGCARV